MLPFQLAARADAYRSAMNQLAQLAAVGKAAGPSVGETVRRLAGNLRDARASRLQLVLSDRNLRLAVARELDRIQPKTPREYVVDLRRNPRRVLTLPGAWNVRQRIIDSVQSDLRVFETLVVAVIEYTKQVKKDPSPQGGAGRQDRDMQNKRFEVLESQIDSLGDDFKSLIEQARARRKDVTNAIDTVVVTGIATIVSEVTNVVENTSGPPAPPPPEEVVDQGCMDEAAQRRDACCDGCPPGPAGNSCRGICEGDYVAAVARCVVS